MRSKTTLAVSALLLLCAVTTAPGCGDASVSLGYAPMAITSILPAALPGSPTPVVIVGGDFSTAVGTNVTVRWTAQTGAPFAGGSASTAEIAGTITGPTTITSVSPAAALCGSASFVVDLEVVLPSGAVAPTTAGLAITFVPPTLVGFLGASNFPGAIETAFTLAGTNLPTGAAASITWTAVNPIFLGGTSNILITVAAVTSPATINGLSPLAQVCGAASELASITDVAFSDGSCTPPGTLVAATFDAPTLTQLNGSPAPADVPSTILMGAVTPEPFTLTGTGFGPTGSFATVDFGAPLSASVPGLVVNDTTITGTLPTFTAPRLTADTTVDVTVTLPAGSCATSVGLANFIAPPTIGTVVNGRPPFDPTTPANPIPDTWLHCVATFTTINGTGFDAGAGELFFDTVIGDAAPIAAGALTADPGPAGTPRAVTPTAITGWSPVDAAITNPLAVSLRVQNPDLQFHEITGLTWTPTGVLPNVNAAPLGGNQAEMQIAVNPTNALNAGICSHHSTGGYVQMNHAFTTDGGLTWTQFFVGPPASPAPDGFSATAFRFDPMCDFDAFGNYYCIYGVDDGLPARSLVVQRSTDGGATFNAADVTILPFPAVPGLDRWTSATGPDASVPGSQVLYVGLEDLATEDQLVAGMSIAPGGGPNGEGGAIGPLYASVGVNDFPAPAGLGFAHCSPSVGPSGELYVSYTYGDYTGVLPPPISSTIRFDRDLDGLGSFIFGFGLDTVVDSTMTPAWRVDIVPQAARGKGLIPIHDVIRTGPNVGRIVLAWTDSTWVLLGPPATLDMTVVTQVSDDGGNTWSTAQPVHGMHSSFQFFPWIGTDPATGHVYVGYYDTRNDAANNRATEWMVAGSRDGVTWVPSVLVAQAPSDAGAAGGLNDMLEYNGISVVGDCIYTCWADNSNFTGDNGSGTLVPDGFDVLTSVLTLDAD